MSRRILLATRNAHKTAEIQTMLGPDWTVEDLLAHPELPEVEETGQTFADNSALKALAASGQFPGAWVLADDSGLEVDALGGAPGVHSARYAGPGADDATNRRHLANELWRTLGDAWQKPQAARFRCVITVAKAGQIAGQFDGTVEGHVVHPEQGKGGFGYDPVFIPEGYGETFGVLPPETKNRLSHRAKALTSAMDFLCAQS